jgi:hypothetical protein
MRKLLGDLKPYASEFLGSGVNFRGTEAGYGHVVLGTVVSDGLLDDLRFGGGEFAHFGGYDLSKAVGVLH